MDKTINIGIIGMGHVYDYQMQALNSMQNIHVVAVTDVDESKKQKIVNGMRFYQDYRLMLTNEHLDAVVVSTPPATHFEIAKFCIQAGVDVLLEKPATIDIKELEELIQFAKNKKQVLVIALHARYSRELQWFVREYRENLKGMLGNIREFVCNFCDPYMDLETGKIKENARVLMGSWMDSGINALSVIDLLVNNLKIVSKEQSYIDDIDVKTTAQIQFDGGTGIICTDWAKNINYKETILRFDSTKEEILLDHTGQRVVLKSDGNEETLITFSGERLVNHYVSVFQDFINHVNKRTDNLDYAYFLHQLLLD